MKQFVIKMQEQFKKMTATGKLFRATATGDEIYNIYLNSFPSGTNPVFRDPASTTHNCNNCKNFVRRYGNIVAVAEDGTLMSIFGNHGIEEPYKAVAAAMNSFIMKMPILDVFFESYNMLDQKLNYEKCRKGQEKYRLGTAENHKRYTAEEASKYGVVKPDEIRTFTHMHVDVPAAFVIMDNRTVEAVTGIYRDKYSVFKRAMEEISLDTLNLVKDLINQGSLLDGPAHLHVIVDAIKYKTIYDSLKGLHDSWLWHTSYSLEERVAKFRNTLIGVLCTELSQGEELNKACESWNKRVDPANYHKATAPITKKQIEEAQRFVEDNGYTESFNRRLATIDDINVSEIKHMSAGDGKIAAPVTIFDNVKATATQHKRAKFDDVEEVTIDKFMADILPNCTGIEAMLLNSHEGNMVTLTTTQNKESKPIFKWDNNFSWNFNGNLAGKSQLREQVQARGGRVDGVFRFSQSWNNVGRNESLMDLHVFMPGNNHSEERVHDRYGTGRRVGWNHRQDPSSGGVQDVDYTSQAPVGYIPVENITFPNLKNMPEGVYICKIHNWALRGVTNGGGTAEVEFGGNVYEYEYPKLGNKEWVTVAHVTLNKGVFTIEHKLPCKTETNREIWGLETNSFHKVNLVCLSPNHWGENAVGNKHYLFMLEGCKADNNVRGFHNENLQADLLKHKKVMEVLGANNTIAVTPTDKQLSGLGFNSTVRDEVILKLSGSFKRVVKVKF